MNTHLSLHPYQLKLLKKLVLAKSGLSFGQLVLDDIASDHSNYHLKELIRFKLVTKQRQKYELTDLGKEYAGGLDDAIGALEKQPKPSVIVWAVRKNKDGKIEHLVNRRLRHPYFGKVGRITGKVQYGETLKDAALRELKEETGLSAKSVALDGVYHKLRMRADGSVVQDNIFFIFFMKGISGKLKPKTEFQENFWVTHKDYEEHRFDFYEDFVIDERDTPHETIRFEESVDVASAF